MVEVVIFFCCGWGAEADVPCDSVFLPVSCVPSCSSMFLKDTAGEPLYKLFKALKHQVEKGPVDAKVKKAKYTLNDTGLLGDDVEYSVLVRAHARMHVHTHLHARTNTHTRSRKRQHNHNSQHNTLFLVTHQLYPKCTTSQLPPVPSVLCSFPVYGVVQRRECTC